MCRRCRKSCGQGCRSRVGTERRLRRARACIFRERSAKEDRWPLSSSWLARARRSTTESRWNSSPSGSGYSALVRTELEVLCRCDRSVREQKTHTVGPTRRSGLHPRGNLLGSRGSSRHGICRSIFSLGRSRQRSRRETRWSPSLPVTPMTAYLFSKMAQEAGEPPGWRAERRSRAWARVVGSAISRHPKDPCGLLSPEARVRTGFAPKFSLRGLHRISRRPLCSRWAVRTHAIVFADCRTSKKRVNEVARSSV